MDQHNKKYAFPKKKIDRIGSCSALYFFVNLRVKESLNQTETKFGLRDKNF